MKEGNSCPKRPELYPVHPAEAAYEELMPMVQFYLCSNKMFAPAGKDNGGAGAHSRKKRKRERISVLPYSSYFLHSPEKQKMLAVRGLCVTFRDLLGIGRKRIKNGLFRTFKFMHCKISQFLSIVLATSARFWMEESPEKGVFPFRLPDSIPGT